MIAIEEIKEVDCELSKARKDWLSATAKQKPGWMRMISRLLDDRLKLMRKRDNGGGK